MMATESHLMATYAPALTLVKGAGTRVWDDEGHEYLDFVSGLAVCSLGHSHPKVARAISAQASELTHVSNLYANTLAPRVATTIDRLIANPKGGKVFFANSGAEANECAIKLARLAGGRGKYTVVTAFDSFHGRTLATLAATGQPAKHEPFAPMPEGFRHVVLNDISALQNAFDASVAAVMIETIQGEGGINPVNSEFVAAARQLCDRFGALLIFDEIQTGFGRTGEWFGHHHFDVRPDVVTMAKALGNGFPVGACWAENVWADLFNAGDHGSTFGGQPLAMAATQAVLSELEAIDAPACARNQGAKLSDRLQATNGVDHVRGAGLLLGAELETGIDAKAVVEATKTRGLLINAVRASTVRFAPPLTVSDDEIDAAFEMFQDAMKEVQR